MCGVGTEVQQTDTQKYAAGIRKGEVKKCMKVCLEINPNTQVTL